ncbi:hypothetical protein BKA70DRAFT_1234156 [Coprinopsis sp. MPI-PUGE-AT-0042]|nr:hypothetical protein BKA70DRAFT_1234156 [Coprinopsis sp. MPI-PUGE-AT-0042]
MQAAPLKLPKFLLHELDRRAAPAINSERHQPAHPVVDADGKKAYFFTKLEIPYLSQEDSLASPGCPGEDSREVTSECPDFFPCIMIRSPGWKFPPPRELQ